mmetsp:Transcript_33231/g.94510  ORF Transcript_33231/g.94510 Transcript_33231/m.94510 type:complete len:269 (-) Transcript_33231:270-1076(-)
MRPWPRTPSSLSQQTLRILHHHLEDVLRVPGQASADLRRVGDRFGEAVHELEHVLVARAARRTSQHARRRLRHHIAQVVLQGLAERLHVCVDTAVHYVEDGEPAPDRFRRARVDLHVGVPLRKRRVRVRLEGDGPLGEHLPVQLHEVPQARRQPLGEAPHHVVAVAGRALPHGLRGRVAQGDQAGVAELADDAQPRLLLRNGELQGAQAPVRLRVHLLEGGVDARHTLADLLPHLLPRGALEGIAVEREEVLRGHVRELVAREQRADA